ncbi:MAG: hypothetical protein J4F43_04680 [Dehalococcoidia bacterium]|nr:hypothetical protein [Dehalococcoidia bacterium]
MPHQTEPSVNNAMGHLLQGMLSRSKVRSENTQAIAGHPGLKPDILITAPDRSPVVVEAEYLPALTVEAEAKSRLGMEAAEDGRTIEAAVALRYPKEVGDADDLPTALQSAPLSYCIFTQGTKAVERFPESGWLEASVDDVSDMIRLVSVPRQAVYNAATAMEEGIERVAKILDEMNENRSAVTTAVARLLGMENVPQSRRMACAIIANAMVFQERIAGMHDNVKSLRLTCGPDVPNPHGETVDAWSRILEINYWPIFAVGRDILTQLPSGEATRILGTLYFTAGQLTAAGIDNAHDLTGRVFQRLIADRKYLATFYTLPASAALLARLAAVKMKGVDWSDSEAIGKLRVGDFACGTGALLSAVYEQIASCHERSGGDPAALHRVMMEEVLYGCDVMPSAVHITGSTLAGTEPSVGFNESRIYSMPYGRMKDGSVAIGSLEYLNSNAQMTLANYTNPALRTGSSGEETASQVIAEVRHESFDLVIMNPPFTSDTKHRDAADGVLNAAFAAFNASDADQSSMAKRLKRLANASAYHGHAGLGSAFAALANKKVRRGGVVAFVLPFTAINGSSWAKFRKLVATKYTDLTIVSIAANGHDMSFSSETGMAECLIIGRRLGLAEKPDFRAKFISLRRRPTSFAHALELSKAISSAGESRHLEDGPFGGIPIYCGDTLAGELLDAPLHAHEDGWGASRILDASVAQVAHWLSAGELRLPAEPSSEELPVAELSELGRLGLDSQLLVSTSHKGPFTKAPASPTATYPALWNHDAQNETRMICAPDSQLLVRPGMEDKAAEVWATTGRAHISRGFRFNSQPLAVASTEQRTAGGRGWPNVVFDRCDHDSAFALWGNSTLGLLCYWWHSNRQVAGRGDMTIRATDSLPVLDLRALTDDQLYTAEVIFEEFRDKELKPAYLADADPNRALLDRRVVCDLLGFDEDTYKGVRRLAAKWCAEPSVHGGKARPKDASLVV